MDIIYGHNCLLAGETDRVYFCRLHVVIVTRQVTEVEVS
jgi:hypothetical protein